MLHLILRGVCRLYIFRVNLLILLIFFLFISSPVHAQKQNLVEDHLIVINKKFNQLAYYQNGVLNSIFPVGTGRTPDLTPEGEFKVVAKFVNPYYTRENIPGGSPENPLGVRWLGLSVGNTGGAIYGIHGNNNPSSIGNYVSAGCIRMYNEDVIWLYDQVPMGTTVRIINEDWYLNNTIEIFVEEKELSYSKEHAPFITQGKTMIPLRLLAEALTYDVTWDNSDKSISISRENKFIDIQIDSKNAIVNNEAKYMDQHPILINNVTFVPLRFISEELGATVDWDSENRTINISF